MVWGRFRGETGWRLELWEADVEARALVGDDAASRVEGLWGRCVLAGYWQFSIGGGRIVCT